VPDELVVALVLAGVVETVTPAMPDPVVLSRAVPEIVELGGAELIAATEKESNLAVDPAAAHP
jgi:hypothetical protein